MLSVADDHEGTERDPVAGELACPDCRGELRPWGHARPRWLRTLNDGRRIRPRRACCRACGRTHVLLPGVMLARRADAVEVICQALIAAADGEGHRPIAARLARPAATVRGWLRRFAARAQQTPVALTLADGGDALRHMTVIDRQPVLFCTVASPATACRTIMAVADDAQAMAGFAGVRAKARERAWRVGAAPPAVKVAWGQCAAEVAGEGAGEPLTIDLDATLIIAHCDNKDGAGNTCKRTWGLRPLKAYLDRGDRHGESLAGMMREGNDGTNTAADHLWFDAARSQLHELPPDLPRLVRADTASRSALLGGLSALHVGGCWPGQVAV